MIPKGFVTVLYNEVAENASKDEIDVLYQVNAVSDALEKLGFATARLAFSENINLVVENLKKMKPMLVFNLVEAVSGKGKLSYLAPAILESMNIKYTGCSAEAILLTTNKITAKKLFRACNIPTPPWVTVHEDIGFNPKDAYIIKAVYEDGSVGLRQDSIAAVQDKSEAQRLLDNVNRKAGNEFFAEKYIDGREINVSILGEKGNPGILAPNEIKFIGYEEKNKAKIVDYSAKWEEDTFEYKNTIPTSNFEDKDAHLLGELKNISAALWKEFGLKGYARVDFRIDSEGRPWVLEINANPCITPGGSGFIRSAEKSGLSFNDVVHRIISEL